MQSEIRNDPSPTPEYDPPEVEQVLSADDMAREVHYAGIAVSGEMA